MKKIKNMRHLKAEKKKLRKKQQELEIEILDNWKGIKKSVQPKSIAKNAFFSWMDKRANEQIEERSILQSTLSYAATLAAKRFVKNTEEKIHSFLKNR